MKLRPGDVILAILIMFILLFILYLAWPGLV
jgi:hypothetical protein